MDIPAWLKRELDRKPDRLRTTTFEHVSDDELENLRQQTEARLHLLDGVTNGYSRQGADASMVRSLSPEERARQKSETAKVLSQLRSECRRRGRF